MKQTAVLVTGATTPLGARLVRAILDRNIADRVVAIGAEPTPSRFEGNPRVFYQQVDLRRPRQIRRLLFGPVRSLAVETVVHSALHRSAIDKGRGVHDLNVESTRLILSEIERIPSIKRFIYRSYSDVYRIESHLPNLIGEDHPLELSPRAPQRTRDRVEADLLVCTRMGMSRLSIVVLRCAEVLTSDAGSQLWDYLSSGLCLRPLGFNPMVNVLSSEDAVRAQILAIRSRESGIFNIPGADTLPLKSVIENWQRRDVPIPGPLLSPLYRLRTASLGLQFRYDLNARRFHVSGVLDGERAKRILDYEPQHRIAWPNAACGTEAQRENLPHDAPGSSTHRETAA